MSPGCKRGGGRGGGNGAPAPSWVSFSWPLCAEPRTREEQTGRHRPSQGGVGRGFVLGLLFPACFRWPVSGWEHGRGSQTGPGFKSCTLAARPRAGFSITPSFSFPFNPCGVGGWITGAKEAELPPHGKHRGTTRLLLFPHPAPGPSVQPATERPLGSNRHQVRV